jgi:glycosyltransferase involved in cell wall biosynthesis
MRKRVLHVVASLSDADGVSIATKTMLQGLAERSDWTTTALVGVFPHSNQDFTVPGVAIHSIRGRIPLGGKLGASTGYPPAFIQTLTGALRDVDVVHLHGIWLYPTLIGSRVARRHRVPYVINPHGSLMPIPLSQKALKKKVVLALWERANLNRAARIIAASSPEADALASLGFKSAITTIPYALSPAAARYFAIHPDRPTPAPSDLPRVVLTVSRFDPSKRLVELIDVFSRLAATHGGWHLTIVGSTDDDQYRARVISTARSSVVASRISVLENVTGPSLWELFRTSQLFVLPSVTENFGLVVIEALAAGVPVIATHGSPWRELESENCGWWTPTSLDALDSTLDRAMALDGHELARRGARGVALVARRYTARAQAAALTALYEDVASEYADHGAEGARTAVRDPS